MTQEQKIKGGQRPMRSVSFRMLPGRTFASRSGEREGVDAGGGKLGWGGLRNLG